MRGSFAFLGLNIFADRILTDVASGPCIVGPRPKRRKPGTQGREFLSKGMRRISLQPINNFGYAESRIGFDEQMQVIRHDFKCMNGYAKFLGFSLDQFTESIRDRRHKHLTSKLRTPDDVVFEGKYCTGVFLISLCHKDKYIPDRKISQ